MSRKVMTKLSIVKFQLILIMETIRVSKFSNVSLEGELDEKKHVQDILASWG